MVVIVDLPAVVAASGFPVAAGAGVRVLWQRPGRAVVRVDTDAGPLVVKASTDPGAFVTEAAAIGRLRAHGLPVAKVIGHAVGPPAYLVLSWIQGEVLSSESPARAQRAAGALLRRVHAIGPDPHHDGALFPGDSTWDSWMAGWLNSALGWWAGVAAPGEEKVRRAWVWFHELAPLLATRGHDLMLFDGRPEHILVAGDDVAGMIDVAELRTGDAAMDLGVLAVADPALLPGVLEGYQPTTEQRAAFSRLVPFYTFLRRISRAEWFQRFGTEDDLTQALARLSSTEIPT